MRYERGAYPRGHNILCKHCSLQFALHPSEKRPGRVDLGACKRGYEPKDKKAWENAETLYQRKVAERIAER